MNTLKTFGISAVVVIVALLLQSTFFGPDAVGGVYSQVTKNFSEGINVGSLNQFVVSSLGNLTLSSTITSSGNTILATTTVENLTTGGQGCTLTDANGGTYTLTANQLAICSGFTFAAGGAGQQVVALTMPATSTMTSVIPNAGDCKEFMYDASNLATATTTTITLGTGHNIIAYTTNDDVIDGNEFALIKMCRAADTDVNTFTTELLNAD